MLLVKTTPFQALLELYNHGVGIFACFITPQRGRTLWQQQPNEINDNQIMLEMGLSVCQPHRDKHDEAEAGKQVVFALHYVLEHWVKAGCQLAASSRSDMEPQ